MDTPRQPAAPAAPPGRYDTVPLEFALCPHLEEVYQAYEHSDLPQRVFSDARKRIADLCPDDDDRTPVRPLPRRRRADAAGEIDEVGCGPRAKPTLHAHDPDVLSAPDATRARR